MDHTMTTSETMERRLAEEQQRMFMEATVPVVRIWENILMVPLIGILDSRRAQAATEMLLAAIEEGQARVVILDISGIPVMDTLVAKHLLRTVAAARLMGAECIVTGVKATISQTIVHLGVDLSGVVTKSTMADGLKLAFDLTGQRVISN